MKSEPVFALLFSHPKYSDDVHYAVESEGHGVYEMRFKRLPNLGDSFLGLTGDDLDYE